MGTFSVKRETGNGNRLFRRLAILLETVNYSFVLSYIADAERVLIILWQIKSLNPLKFNGYSH